MLAGFNQIVIKGESMDQEWLDSLHNWFERYVRPFCATDAEAEKNIRLKIEHTRKVCHVMDRLSSGEGLGEADRILAGAVALLHDVGRFPQYRRWRTFRDADSANHARLAIEVIRQENLLAALTGEQRLIIEEAVRFHNLISIPERLQSPTDRFLRLIRDADKLDIWRVFVEHFAVPAQERASAALLGLPERDGVSRDCVAALAGGRLVRLDTVACVNDFRLMLIAWVFDLNSTTSCGLLGSFGYLETLAARLPADPETRNAVRVALDYLAEKAPSLP